MSVGRIEYATLNSTHIFKLVGEVRAQSCISLDRLLSKINSEPENNVNGALIDLTETTFLDSTILGILAKLAIQLKQKYQVQAIILSTNSDITALAESMGLDELFVMLNLPNFPPQCEMQPINTEQSDQTRMLRTVLEAHQVLMRLNQKNKDTFQPLVAQLQCQNTVNAPSKQHKS